MIELAASLLEPLLFAVLMGGIGVWIARSRRRAEAEGAPGIMRHSPALLVLALVGAIFFSALAVLAHVSAETPEDRWIALWFLPFVLLGGLLAMEYLNVRHRVTDEGLHYGTLVGARGHLAWHELRRVSYSPSMQWFLLETRNRKRVRISAMLTGLPELARMILLHAPSHVVEDKAKRLLVDAREGQLPRVWM